MNTLIESIKARQQKRKFKFIASDSLTPKQERLIERRKRKGTYFSVGISYNSDSEERQYSSWGGSYNGKKF